jgi:hypothetical protein
MRCQKARSYLSAYCRDELSSHEQLSVREHLAECASCRREEVIYRSMFQGAKAIETPVLKADFNAKLLNRIAQERFEETRTNAYLPRRAPYLTWPRLIPVVTVLSLALFITFGTNLLKQKDLPIEQNNLRAGLDDSYLTVQPENGTNTVARVDKNWSFQSQLAQTERFNRLSGMITREASFGNSESQMGLELIIPPLNSCCLDQAPAYKIRPVLRRYDANTTNQVKETLSVY